MSSTSSTTPAALIDLATLSGTALLPPEIQAQSGMKRLDYIVNLPDTAGFVRALPVPDLYLLLRDIGTGDAYLMLEYATPKQFLGLMDLDIWTKHEVQLTRWVEWFDLAKNNSVETIERLIQGTEDELFQLMFTGDIEVHPSDMDLDMVPDTLQAYQTPDGLYWVTLDREHPLSDRLPELMRHIWSTDMDRARVIFQSCQFELRSQVEEHLIRFRAGRLEEMGFCDPTAAQALYSRVNLVEARDEARALTPADRATPHTTGMMPSALVLSEAKAQGLLAEAMSRLSQEARDTVAQGFTLLINRAFLARTGDLSQTDRLPDAGRHVTALVNLGLAYLAGEHPDRAAMVLNRFWPQRVFQAGYSLTLSLALRARRLRWRAGHREGLTLFGDPIDPTLEGAAMPRPLFYDGLTVPGAMTFRDYETLGDLSRMEILLDDTETLMTFFEERLGFTPEALLEAALGGMDLDARREVRLATLFRTAVAHLALSDEVRFDPLTRDEMVAFLGFAVIPKSEPPTLSEPLRALPDRLGAENETVARWMERSLEELALALGRVSDQGLDPRYVNALILVEGA